MKRKASRNMSSTSSRASFRMKKVEPQMRVATTMRGRAIFFRKASFTVNQLRDGESEGGERIASAGIF